MLYDKNLARTLEDMCQENLSGNTGMETSAPISKTLDTFLHTKIKDPNAKKKFSQPA